MNLHQQVEALARRWVMAVATAPWDGKTWTMALASVHKVVRATAPGVPWNFSYKGLSAYGNTPDPYGFIRFELPDSRTAWVGVFSAPEIAFQAGWDTARKKFVVTSFKEELAFPTPERLVAFLLDASKVTALIRKGLKTLDPGLAAFYSGKITPDGVVNRVVEVKASFEVVDEWHSTTLNIVLMLRTAKPVPQNLLKAWLKAHWAEVQKLAPAKTPEPAGRPSRWASYDDYDDDQDDQDDSDWEMDHPAPGLGWLVPNRMTYDQVEGFGIRQEGNRATVSAHASIR